MKTICDKGCFVAFHSILHQADWLFDDSEYLESELKNENGNKRGGFVNYYLPLLLMYVSAIESLGNSVGAFMIDNFDVDFDKLSPMDKLRLCYEKLGLKYELGKDPLNTLNDAVKVRNRWVHCKPLKECFPTEWESNSFEDIHDPRSELEKRTNKNFILKIKKSTHEIVNLLKEETLKQFPAEKEDLKFYFLGNPPVRVTELDYTISFKESE